ncbi:MAG: hypothetical protein KKB35_03785 [Proteobacteria bacterium]|nr:hypothetical protein [Pseudomonadota bacterium]
MSLIRPSCTSSAITVGRESWVIVVQAAHVLITITGITYGNIKSEGTARYHNMKILVSRLSPPSSYHSMPLQLPPSFH